MARLAGGKAGGRPAQIPRAVHGLGPSSRYQVKAVKGFRLKQESDMICSTMKSSSRLN